MKFLLSQVNFKLGTVLFFIFSLPFIIIAGIRGGTPDSQIYYNVLANIETLNLYNPIVFYRQTGMEIGFGWYSWLVNLFTTSSIWLFGVFSFCTFYFIYKSSRLIKVDYALVLVFYIPSAFFLLQQLMQMRQGLAIAISLYAAIRFFYKQEALKSLVLIFIGFLFHQTALFFLAFSIVFFFIEYLARKLKVGYVLLNVILLLTFIVFFKFIFLDLLISLSPRLQSYAASANFASSVSMFNPQVLKTILILFFITLCVGPKMKEQRIYKFFVYLEFLSLAIRVGFSDFAIMSGRLSTVFSHVEIFLLPLIVRDRISMFLKVTCIPIFFAMQAFITLHLQAPYLLEFYSKPLNVIKNA